MTDKAVQNETRGHYRLTYRVRPPAWCPVREITGTISELSVFRKGTDQQCELLVRDEDGNVTVQQFTHPATDSCPCSVVVEEGVLPHIRPAESGGKILLTTYVSEGADAQSISEALDATAVEADLINYNSLDTVDVDLTARVDLGVLTQKRRTAFRRALNEGYYETPSETTIEEMAEQTGISSSAFATRLRKAEREVFEQIRRSI